MAGPPRPGGSAAGAQYVVKRRGDWRSALDPVKGEYWWNVYSKRVCWKLGGTEQAGRKRGNLAVLAQPDKRPAKESAATTTSTTTTSTATATAAAAPTPATPAARPVGSAGTVQTSIQSFLRQHKTRSKGRPRKSASNRGRKKGAGAGPKAAALAATARRLRGEAAAEEALIKTRRVKKKRTSFAPGTAAHDALTAAIAGWGPAKARGVSAKAYVRQQQRLSGIASDTLMPYISGSRVLKPNTTRGRPALLDPDQRRVVMDAAASADRGNRGMVRKQLVQEIQDFADITPRQAGDHLARTLLKEGRRLGVLTGNLNSAQSTTAARSQVTARQQARWHGNCDVALAEQRRLNGPDGTGVAFADVQDNFVLNLDEESLGAFPNGSVKVVGAAGQRKHERETPGRTTCSMIKVINSAGDVGPCYFLMTGKKPRAGYTDAWLLSEGAPPGSRIIMTPSGYLTDEAWDELSAALAEGVRSMPVIKDHPEWTALSTFDGYHAHKATLKAQMEFLRRKLMCLAEEADNSQVAQPFDREVAKYGKSTMREALDLSMRHFAFTGPVDQWDLLAVALHCLRELMKRPRVVVDSFKACNLKPSCRVDLAGWLEKVKWALVGGAKYKDEGVVTPRMLLPGWYTNLTDEVRSSAMGIVERGAGWADLTMVEELLAHLKLTPAMLPKYMACYFVEQADPSNHDVEVALPVQDTQAFAVDPNAGLSSYQLKPAGLEGVELFKHMVRHRDRRKQRLQPAFRHPAIDTLDLAVGGRVEEVGGRHSIVSDQMRVIQPTEHDLTAGAILREVGVHSASVRIPQRVLNVLGEVNAYSIRTNTHERLERLTAVTELAATLDRVRERQRHAKALKSKAGKDELRTKAVHGLAKLRAAATTDPSEAGLTVDEMRGVALVHICKDVKKASKQAVTDAFNKAVREGAWELPAAAAP